MRTPPETGGNDRPDKAYKSIPHGKPAATENPESFMRRYFYNILASYLSLYIRPENTVVEIAPRSEGLGMRFTNYRAVSSVAGLKTTQERMADYVLFNGTIHYERDIQGMLDQLRELLQGSERVLFVYYSMLWKPLARLAAQNSPRQRHTRI